MNVALGGTSTPLGRTLAAALSVDHRVVALPDDPREPEQVRRALTGIEAVILLPPAVAPALPSPAPDSAAEALQTDWRRARELLDRATRGTYTVCTAALEAGVRRVVLGSALSLFERYPPAWAVTESWRPLPDVRDPVQLATYLAEASAKQLAHSEPLQVVCLRFGTLVDDATISGRPYDPRWVHVADVVQAYRLAVDRPPRHRAGDDERQPVHGWWVYHIPGGGADRRWPLAAAQGERGLGYQPTYDFAAVPGAGARPAVGRLDPAALAGERATLEPSDPIPTRPIRRVVLLGAGGPLAAVTARELAASYRLRLTDRRPLAEIVAAATPQSPGAPLPQVLGPPHETMVADVTDYEAVLRACAGMDAIINCTVNRPDPALAFLVNCIGAYHVMRAAVTQRIRRVVQTGPQQVASDRPAGYGWDFGVPDDAPPRPGVSLYGHSKYLGQEIVRLFAEYYALETPTMQFSSFINPAVPPRPGARINPMSVSWDDAALAMRRALETPSLPSPFLCMHIVADLPFGKYSGATAQRVLHWRPRDDLAHLWARRSEGEA